MTLTYQKEEPEQEKEPVVAHKHPRLRDDPWGWLKSGLYHYYVGTKLLALEVKTTVKIVGSITQGNRLSRRERRQLLRTFTDLLRVIPFAIFVIVPFMEFLLPVALKVFPNMLPSTFEDKLKVVTHSFASLNRKGRELETSSEGSNWNRQVSARRR